MKTIKFNISASSYNLYKKSPLQFFYQYIAKPPIDTEVVTVYGSGGNVCHELLEQYIKDKNSIYNEEMQFYQLWRKKKLDVDVGLNGKPLAPEKYFNAFKIGIIKLDEIYNKMGKVSSEEEIILPFFDNINLKGYIDVVIKKENGDVILLDWKTSSNVDNGEAFFTQGKTYFLLYYLKHNVLPKKIIFEYIKIGKQKEYSFSLEEIKEFYAELKQAVVDILKKGWDETKYDTGDYDDIFNSYKKRCEKEYLRRLNGDKIIIEIKNSKLWLPEDLDKTIIKMLDDKYSYLTEGYQWSEKYKKRLWDGKKHYLKRNTLPLGYINSLKKFFQDYNKVFNKDYKLEFWDNRDNDVMNKKYSTKFKDSEKQLRDYQKHSVKEAIEREIGIINLSTGLGKTLVATEIIRKLNTRSLFIVNRLELVTQTKEVLEEELGVEVGEMSEGNLEVDKQITVACIQTMYSIIKNREKDGKELKKYLYNVNLVIWDECHNCSYDSDYYKFVRQYVLNAKYIIGLTATPFRNQNSTLDMNSLVGYPVVCYDTEFGEKNGYLCPTKSVFIKNRLPKTMRTTYPEVYSEVITNNKDRNNKVAKICEKFRGKKILITTKIIEHAFILQKLIPDSMVINSSVNRKDRKETMSFFKNDKDGCVMIAGAKIVGQGLNIPDLDVIINVGAHKSPIDSVQIIGRVKRKFPGKDYGYMIDFFDNNDFFKASNERVKTLKSFGNSVEVIDWDDFDNVVMK